MFMLMFNYHTVNKNMSTKEFLQHMTGHKHMQFAPVQEDDDELSQAIKDDPAKQDDQWDLTDSIDAQALDLFWADAVRELEPEEKQFTQDN